jgi:iron complex transport system ATP-binding protein
VREVVETGYFGTIGLYDPLSDARRAEALRVVRQVGLGRVADHAYSTLSSGERVRALIGRALVARPQLLLLDEPTAGLDLLAREQVLATIESVVQGSAGGTADWRPTVLMITHHVEELPPSTSQVLLLDDGTAAASGHPDQVLRPEILSKVYHCPVEVTQRGGRYSLYVHPSAWEGLLNRSEG